MVAQAYCCPDPTELSDEEYTNELEHLLAENLAPKARMLDPDEYDLEHGQQLGWIELTLA